MKNKIAVYGLEGSYTDQALKNVLRILKEKENFNLVEKPIFTDLFNFLNEGNMAFFPIENSVGGTVVQAVDLFPKYNFEIIAEYYMPINHCVLVNREFAEEKIERVYSHPQSLLQCSEYIAEKNIKEIPDSDNSAAAKRIADFPEKGAGAIGGEVLADLYDLKIIEKKIQNSKNNITRFVLVKPVKNNKVSDNLKNKIEEIEEKIENFDKNNKKEKTTIIFEARDIPGALYKNLGGFVTNGVNLSKIESRPNLKKNFDYYFLLEFEGGISDNNVKNAMEELEFFSEEYRVFGSYKELK